MIEQIRPKFITFTGVDDQTPLLGLQVLCDTHPVEFAVLLSAERHGKGRYPSLDFVEQLAQVPGLRLAAHLCGAWALEFAETGTVTGVEELLLRFGRIQINTSRYVDPVRAAAWGRQYLANIIVQCRGPFPDNRDVTWLFDCSGGRGVLPPHWPSQDNAVLVGYAGGLGPATVTQAVRDINRAGARNYYLDMESGVRNCDDRFDLGLCHQVVHQVFGEAPAAGPATAPEVHHAPDALADYVL